jgi:predicted RNase H-like HicB family nuclease
MITGIPTGTVLVNSMIIQYIETALAHARYDMINDEEPFYGEVHELPGVWATGKTLEECRRNLVEVIDGWIVVRLRRGLPIPPIDRQAVQRADDSGCADRCCPKGC